MTDEIAMPVMPAAEAPAALTEPELAAPTPVSRAEHDTLAERVAALEQKAEGLFKRIEAAFAGKV